MTSHDDEFDEFLRKRRPLFGRDDELEPPLELDRVVLRQAREAIESARPHRMFRAPSWGMPVALAATLVLAFTIILRTGTPEAVKKPEVTVQNISREIEIPAAAAPSQSADQSSVAAPAEAPLPAEQPRADGAVVVDLGADAVKAGAADSETRSARRLEKVADAAAPARGVAADTEAANYSPPAAVSAAAAPPPPPPEYRRTAKAWLAEIERLRATGETARADQQRRLAIFERDLRIVGRHDLVERRERAVIELHDHARELRQRRRDLEQVQVHRRVDAEHLARGDAEGEGVTDLPCGTGDGDIDGGFHRRSSSVPENGPEKRGRNSSRTTRRAGFRPCFYLSGATA